MKRITILLASLLILGSCAESGIDDAIGQLKPVTLGEEVEVTLPLDNTIIWENKEEMSGSTRATNFEEVSLTITLKDLWIICIDPSTGGILWSQYSDNLNTTSSANEEITITVPTTDALTTMIYIANSANTDLMTGVTSLNDIYALSAAEISSSDDCKVMSQIVSGGISQEAITTNITLKKPTLHPILALIDVYVSIPIDLDGNTKENEYDPENKEDDDMSSHISFRAIRLKNIQPEVYYFAPPAVDNGPTGLDKWPLFPDLGKDLTTIDYFEDDVTDAVPYDDRVDVTDGVTYQYLHDQEKKNDDVIRYRCQYYAPVNRRDGSLGRETMVNVMVRSNGDDLVYSFAESKAIEPGYHYIYNITLNGFDEITTDDTVENDMIQIIDYTPLTKQRTNCYILSPRDYTQIFYIPIDRINKFWGNQGYENFPERMIDVESDGTSKKGSEWMVESIWHDFTYEDADIVDRTDVLQVERSVSPETGYDAIKVILPAVTPTDKFYEKAQGNILVGVKKNAESDEYLWSWHLWVTNYDPNNINYGYADANNDGIFESRIVDNGSIRHYEDGGEMHIQHLKYEAQIAPLVEDRKTARKNYEDAYNNWYNATNGNQKDIYENQMNDYQAQIDNLTDKIVPLQTAMDQYAVWENGGRYQDKWIMDRNIGEIFDEADTDSSHQGDRATGRGILLYQFGRSTPFARIGVAKDKFNKPFVYKIAPAADKMYEGVLHPDTYFLSNVSGHWHNDPDYTSESALPDNYSTETISDRTFLWGDKLITGWGSNAKSIFDPSPLGWKVPNYQVWNAFADDKDLKSVDASYNPVYGNAYSLTHYTTGRYYCYGEGSNNHSHYSYRYYLDGTKTGVGSYEDLESDTEAASLWSSTPGYKNDENGTNGYLFRMHKLNKATTFGDGVILSGKENGANIQVEIIYNDLEPQASAHMVRPIMR